MFIFAIFSCSQNEYNIKITTEKKDILYVGINNPIEISVLGIKNKDIMVTISNGMVRKTKEGNYIVYVKKVGKTQININYNGKQIGTKEFDIVYSSKITN